MSAEQTIPGGVVHDLPADLKGGAGASSSSAGHLGGHYAARPERVDLLDHIAENAGDPAQADRLGLLEPERGQAPAVLLARMSAPVTRLA